jgi:hypothetical protein
MRRNGIPFIALLFALTAAPLALMPLLGASLVSDLPRLDLLDNRDDTPLRLVSGPLIPVDGQTREFYHLAVDLPSRAAADRVCEMAPRVLDAVQVFARTRGASDGGALRVPGNDASLTKRLVDLLPDVPLDGARLIRRERAETAHPRRPLYECRSGSGRPILEREDWIQLH